MVRLNPRLMITPIGRLVGWRRLHPERMGYSGQFYPFRLKGAAHRHERLRYISYIEFDFIKNYKAWPGFWEDHILGERDGKTYVLNLSECAQDTGLLL